LTARKLAFHRQNEYKEKPMRRSPASPELRPQFLLEGTVYALEQGGLLLHDSVLLFRNENYASAAALALFAIEEIGRSRLLHHLWKEAVEKGRAFTAQTIRLKCENHVFKQTLGQGMPVLYVSKNDKKLYQLFQTTLVEHLTPESLKASAEIQAIAKRLHWRVPNQRHDWRQKSLYVEPDGSGTNWNRPKDLHKKIAFDSLFGANDVYFQEVCRFNRTGSFKKEDPAYHSALKAWKEYPELPSALSGKEIEDLWMHINR
jgi:AbiV family abortive infection protein